MNPPQIFTGKEENRDQIIQSIVLGFSTDPLARWFWADANTYLDSGPGFDAFGGRSIDSGTAYVTKGYEGVALWMPPGVEPDEERLIPLWRRRYPRRSWKMFLEYSRQWNPTTLKSHAGIYPSSL